MLGSDHGRPTYPLDVGVGRLGFSSAGSNGSQKVARSDIQSME
jgi:hypothetical protein